MKPSKISAEIVQCGRELGDSLFEQVYQEAQDFDELCKGMMVLQVAMVHVLGLCGFNAERQEQGSAEALFQGFREQMTKDLATFLKAEKDGNVSIVQFTANGKVKKQDFDA